MTMQAMPMMPQAMPATALGGKAAAAGKGATAADGLFAQLLADTGLTADDLQAALAALPPACRQKFHLTEGGEMQAQDPQAAVEGAAPAAKDLLALLKAAELPQAATAKAAATAPGEAQAETKAEGKAKAEGKTKAHHKGKAEVEAQTRVDLTAVMPDAKAENAKAADAQAALNAAAAVPAAPVAAAKTVVAAAAEGKAAKRPAGAGAAAALEAAGAQLAQTEAATEATATEAEEATATAETAAQPTAKAVPSHLQKEMDQRFAQLLRPKEAATAQAPVQAHRAPTREAGVNPSVTAAAASTATEAATAATATATAEPLAKLQANLTAKIRLDATAGHHQAAMLHGAQPQQQAAPAQAAPPAPMLTLTSGQQVPEAAVLAQVVTHLAGSADGESGKMVLRLKPAELGELKIDLVMQGDQLKAHLHAQSQQVQDVLERNLPRLRDALQQHGVRMDEVRVSVDSGHDSGQSFQQHQAHQDAHRFWNASAYRAETPVWDPEAAAVPLYRVQSPGGINLHV